MKKAMFSFALSFLAFDGARANLDSSKLKTEKQKTSYVLGRQVGENFKSSGFDIDQKVFFTAFEEAMGGKPSAVSREQTQEIMNKFQSEMMKKMQKQMSDSKTENEKLGQKYRDEYKKKKGVTSTPSGLLYRVITPAAASAVKPKTTDTVKVHYKGTLVTGKEFDSSYSRNQPATFELSAVIKGWTEGLQLMPVGSKYEFVIPPELAYGDQAPASIGPGSTLVFEVELLAIEKPKPSAVGK